MRIDLKYFIRSEIRDYKKVYNSYFLMIHNNSKLTVAIVVKPNTIFYEIRRIQLKKIIQE